MMLQDLSKEFATVDTARKVKIMSFLFVLCSLGGGGIGWSVVQFVIQYRFYMWYMYAYYILTNFDTREELFWGPMLLYWRSFLVYYQEISCLSINII